MERPTRIHHLALRVGDPERSLRFYGGVLGLDEARRFDEGGRVRSIWMAVGDAVLMLEREIKGAGAPSSCSIVAMEGGREPWSLFATASAWRIARRMFPLASLPRSASDQPRRASSAKGFG